MKTITKSQKTMRYKVSIMLISSLLLAEITTAQPYAETRTFKRSVPVNRDMTLEINNKYGTIHISPGASDSVSIKAELEATASNGERAEKMLHGININFSETSYMVKAETEFTQTINELFETFKGITKKIIPYDSRIQINYYVSAPDYLNLRIINRYGDVYIENCNGDFTLDLSNGSFKANKLNKSAHINLNFCDATVNNIREGWLDASFSDLIIGESDNLSLSSVSSRFDLKKTGTLDASSRRDKFFIGTAGIIRGNSYFSDFRVEELKKEINLVSKYGSINSDNIGKTIELVNINSSYTDIYLTFDPAASYNLDIRHTNSFVVIPEHNARVEKKSIDEEKKQFLVSGPVGKNPGDVKVVIESVKGNIHIK